MFTLIDTLQEIFHYLRQYKARTAMTMFGITWGTMTVILLLAFGVGVRKQMSKNMHGIGEGIAIVWPGRTSIPFKGYGRDRRIRLTGEDVELIRREIGDIKRISPEYQRWGTAVHVGDKVNKPNITGIIPEYNIMRNIWPQPGGRWLNDLDLKERRRVVFLGNRLKDLLFGEDVNAVGKYAFIAETPFLVVGVLQKKIQNSSYSSRDQDRAFIPVTTFQSIFGDRYMDNFVYQIADPRNSPQVKKQLYTLLGKKFKFDPNDEETLGIWDTTEFDKFIFYFSLGFNIFMGIIGVITLIVGGIGLANIMYVVVQERTHEIGIRRSIGAKQKSIMNQFIIEAFIVIGMSATIGFLLAIGLIQLLSALPIQSFKEAVGTPVFSPMVAIVTVLILSTIGFLAGYFPARRASRLNVVECLR
ncbi:MAG: FtsX-like permease family protein [Actinobacteria bacterium]|nr:FtsX-like permease family protein [Actinomycetota bacterium]